MAVPIIGLTGFGGSGKDEVASALIDCGFTRRSMGDKLRELVIRINPLLDLGVDGYRRYNDVVRDIGYTEAKRKYPKAFRACLVDFGDGMRKVMGEDVWLDQVLKPNVMPAASIVITDVRYLNEVARILSLGGQIWCIRRPGVGAANETEAASMAQIVPNVIIHNDSTLLRLHENVRDLATRP